jgi:hypothetical protein
MRYAIRTTTTKPANDAPTAIGTISVTPSKLHSSAKFKDKQNIRLYIKKPKERKHGMEAEVLTWAERLVPGYITECFKL